VKGCTRGVVQQTTCTEVTYSDSDDTVLHIHLQTHLHGDNWLVQQTSWLNSQLLMTWRGEEETGTPYKYSIPNGLFMLFCSCYYTVDEGRSLLTINWHIRPWNLPNISHYWLFKLFLWTAVMRHDTQVSLNDYWSMTEQFFTQLYSRAAMWHIPAHSFMPPLSEQSYCYWNWDRLWHCGN